MLNRTFYLAVPASSSQLASGAAAFSEALRRRSGLDVSLLAMPSHAALQALAEQGGADLVWAPPLVAADLSRFGVATPLCAVERGGRTCYPSVLIVRADGADGADGAGLADGAGCGGAADRRRRQVRSLDDLQGARVAWVSRLSAAGCVVPRLFLQATGLLPSSVFSQQRYVHGHEQVLDAVRSGEADVGATYASFRRFSSALELSPSAAGLRILAVAGSVPSELVMVTRAVPRAAASRLREALVSLDIGAIEPLRAALSVGRLVPARVDHLDKLEVLMNRARLGSLPPGAESHPPSVEALRFFET
jgi:ABC-type phosphate/phosphonate transport system substrate-binding protein